MAGKTRALDQLERFTDELGGRDVTPYVTPVAGRPYVIRVIKEPEDELNFANAWHTDLSYLPEPPAYTVLHQNATFTAKPKAIRWKAAPAFAMDFRPGNYGT